MVPIKYLRASPTGEKWSSHDSLSKLLWKKINHKGLILRESFLLREILELKRDAYVSLFFSISFFFPFFSLLSSFHWDFEDHWTYLKRAGRR